MTTDDLAARTYRPFSQAFFEALLTAISEASGAPWLAAAVPDAQTSADESELVRMNVVLAGDLQGVFLLEFRRAAAAMLAAKCLREPAGEFGTEQTEALVKCVQVGMDKFCTAHAEEYGSVTGNVSIAAGPASDSVHVSELTAADDGGNRVSILMNLNPILGEALSLRQKNEAVDEDKSKSAKAPEKERQQSREHLNLQLVMDVELNVTLRFGQRQLALREVLELTSGSVIELDRHVEEPVELLLEGKVIARGEAVVIDGNYGLRVTEVPQPVPNPVLR